MENNNSFQKSLSNVPIKQSINWIGVSSHKYKNSYIKQDNWDETLINNLRTYLFKT